MQTRSKESLKRIGMIAYTNYVGDGRVRLEAESLVQWGYEVYFLVPKTGETPRQYTLAGVNVIEVNAQEYGGRKKFVYLLSYIVFMTLALVACTRLYFRRRLSVIHVHNMPNVLVLAAIIPRMFGCHIILDLHDTIVETYQAKFGKSSKIVLFLLKLEERVCCAIADKIICVNKVQRDVVLSRGVHGEKVATVVTMPRFTFSDSRPVLDSNTSRFRMVNHGTLSKRLGNDLIIDAAAKLVHEIPGFELHIIGAGDGLPEIESKVQSLGLEHRIHLHPVVPWDRLPAQLQTMDVGIVANRVNVATELMLPSKLIDYVVLGIPAIVPRLKAIEYYFSDEMVTFFTPEDVNSMVAATVSLYRNAARRRKQAESAREFVRQNSWDRGGLKKIYEHLVFGEQNAQDSTVVENSVSPSLFQESGINDAVSQHASLTGLRTEVKQIGQA